MPSSPYERIPLTGDAEDAFEPSVAHEPEASSSRAASRQSAIRPAVYYGDGPFDPPSSDDEDEAFLEKKGPASPGIAERGGDNDDDGELVIGGGVKKRPTSLRYLVICLASLVLLAAGIGVFAASSYRGTSTYRAPGAKHITMDHVFNGTFSISRQSVRWVPEAGDGVFSSSDGLHINLVDLKSNTTKTLVSTRDVKDEDGRTLSWGEWKLSADMSYILIKADQKKQWRHSSFGNYYIHDLTANTTHPLIPPTDPPTTAYATWSPTGQSIAFVSENDLYVLPDPALSTHPIRVTNTGTASVFNGVPDWVYEEEVFSADYALWWSPDSSKVAFLSFDETEVDEYIFPVYNPSEDSSEVVPYPDQVKMKYPKPGYNNPIVEIKVFELDKYLKNAGDVEPGEGDEIVEDATLVLDWEGRHEGDNSIIMEVAWVGDTTLIVKEVNRAADDGNVVFFELEDEGESRATGKITRKLGRNGEQGDEGWIEASQNIFPLPPSITPQGTSAYLDIVPSPDGYNHIALFSPADSDRPVWLTLGNYEVTAGISSVDTETGLVYFEAAYPSSTERHIFSVPIPTISSATMSEEPKPLTDTSTPSYYNANFSPAGKFYLLSYQGPNIPWQRIVSIGDADFKYVLADNARLNDTYSEFETPIITHSTIDSDGYELNVMEMRPPRMDDSGRTKYPVLFRVYGGPGSQMVHRRFDVDWHAYVACSLQYIVVVVDGRGTGFKGRKLRNPVSRNLGFFEVLDQVEAARAWASKPYVDPKRIGIWGWSYGGFMSSKVVEADAGIHSLAMAVAPVTSWRLYDSIYTERYMNLPEANPGGYVNASISNVTAFHKVDYLLAHGSGDDNVHFANSAHLLDMLTREKVRGFRFRMFTDSDHSISRRGAYRELFEWMTEFLIERWGKGGRRRGW